jgi:hypothetical protein
MNPESGDYKLEIPHSRFLAPRNDGQTHPPRAMIAAHNRMMTIASNSP